MASNEPRAAGKPRKLEKFPAKAIVKDVDVAASGYVKNSRKRFSEEEVNSFSRAELAAVARDRGYTAMVMPGFIGPRPTGLSRREFLAAQEKDKNLISAEELEKKRDAHPGNRAVPVAAVLVPVPVPIVPGEPEKSEKEIKAAAEPQSVVAEELKAGAKSKLTAEKKIARAAVALPAEAKVI